MDSWMPWTITCNFVRSFSPTLVLVISGDLCRNLFYLRPIRTWAVATDAIALCVVSSIRLLPPLLPVRAQMKYVFDKYYIGATLVFAALSSPKTPAIPMNVFFVAAGFALCNDLARICKISFEDAELLLHRFYWAAGIVIFLTYFLASSVIQMAKGTFIWRDLLAQGFTVALLILILAIIKWWANGREPIPHIQELGLNQSGTRKSA